MMTILCSKVFLILLILVCTGKCWDSEEMELFDLVEEINQNFYEVMGIAQDATTSEVKKAYRRLSLQLHPDKNDAEDAEVKFRQMVAIYEVLRDDERRSRYNKVLVEGLPDWQSPIYYYRRARKMSLLEISIILTVVISITQYLMAWGSYIDKKQCMEEQLMKKYKIKDRKKKKQEDLENISLMEQELGEIPRPSWKNVLPIQLVKLIVFLVTGGPSLVKGILASVQEEKERRRQEKLQQEEEEKRVREEEEKKKAKKASRKEGRKRVNQLPDYSNGGCILEAVDGSESDGQSTKAQNSVYNIPVVTGGPWTDDDFCELARLMAKYPGGTVDRWEKIAETMQRTVYEVTRMSSKVKNQLMQRSLEQEEEDIAVAKVKVKTKAEKSDMTAGCDEMWTPVQHKALEKALKQFPKGTDQRWDRIAKVVPEKTKEDCMLRFKYLAEKIKKKKAEEAEKQESQEQEEGHIYAQVNDKEDVSKGCETYNNMSTSNSRNCIEDLTEECSVGSH
ncbi:DnaJ subfamily C member 1 [Halocaridina rubra]|uniref:DnaJ subfamily C member 1 n=1 Tax=Halocaridina rubra TaxID=373956 RepID=A0AAN8WM05_HALRR